MGMDNEKRKRESRDVMTELTGTAQNLLEQGNRRRVLARAEDGRVMFDVPLTYVVGGALALFFLLPGWGWIIGLALLGYGYVNRIKLELVRELTDEDDPTIRR